MEFIATYWWLWLAVTIACSAYCWFNQVRRMKGMLGGFTRVIKDPGRASASDLVDAPFRSFFSGMGSMIVAGLLASASGVLLVIAIVLHVIRFANAG